ncbi:MAG: hydroxymethylbilane synthase [Halobacteriales archaeon]
MTTNGGTVRLATRSSDLALRQAASVREALSSRRFDLELVEVDTRGDQVRDELIHRLGTTGAFVRSLDERVLAGDVDGAVHSMKDVPTEIPEDLVVAAVPERATANDLLVTPEGRSLADLPDGATVGTASLRRGAQIRRERPDLEIEGLRGNVDTRVEKLLAPGLQREHRRRLDAEDPDPGEDLAGEPEETTDGENEDGDESQDPNGDDGDELSEFDRSLQEWFDDLAEIERRALERDVGVEYDAIVLAAAGLERMGLRRQVGTHELPTDAFVPSAGQGAIAVTTTDGDLAETIRSRVDHPPTRVAAMTERAVLSELGAGCVAPVGIHAVLQGEYVTTAVQVLSRDGSEAVEATRDLPAERHVAAAREFAADLADRGATELIARAKRDDADDPKRGD